MLMEFGRELEERALFGRFKLTRTSCLGPCDLGPTVLVYPEGVMYGRVQASDVREIIEDHLLGDHPVERLKVPEAIWS
jgi:(2Fe-2S) ferredoxin